MCQMNFDYLKLDPKEIARIANERESTSGIYYLIKEDEIVYIGQSVCCEIRVYQHPDKDWDNFHIIRVDQGLLNEAEADAILHYKPRLNRGIPRNDLWPTIKGLHLVHKIPNMHVDVVLKRHNIRVEWFLGNNYVYFPDFIKHYEDLLSERTSIRIERKNPMLRHLKGQPIKEGIVKVSGLEYSVVKRGDFIDWTTIERA